MPYHHSTGLRTPRDRQVFLDNFIHGDLHPGNLLVGRRENSAEPCLVMLDAGIVCELTGEDRKNFLDLFHAIVVGDGRLAGQLILERVRHVHWSVKALLHQCNTDCASPGNGMKGDRRQVVTHSLAFPIG